MVADNEKYQWISQPLAWASAMSRAAVWMGGAMMLASVALVSFDILARRFFGWNTGGADELSGYAFAISTSWALAFATLQRANVRVDVIYERLPTRVAAVLDWLSLVALAVFIAYMTRWSYEVVATSWLSQSEANTTLATPLWIPQGMWLLGLVWMCVVLALMLLRASLALVSGDLQTLRAICGTRSAQEEAQEEAAAGERIIHEEQRA